MLVVVALVVAGLLGVDLRRSLVATKRRLMLRYLFTCCLFGASL